MSSHIRFKETISALLLVLSLRAQTPIGSEEQKRALAEDQKGASDKIAVPSPIRFAYQPISFILDSSETPQCHAPETMAGGLAVFDYNNDGRPDIFDLVLLHRDIAKIGQRLGMVGFEGQFRPEFLSSLFKPIQLPQEIAEAKMEVGLLRRNFPIRPACRPSQDTVERPAV